MINCRCPQLESLRDQESKLDKIGMKCREYADWIQQGIENSFEESATEEDLRESFSAFVELMNRYSLSIFRAILEDDIMIKDSKRREINLKYTNLDGIKNIPYKYCRKCNGEIIPLKLEDYGFSLRS